MKRILLTKIFFLSFTVAFATPKFWVGTPGNNLWSNPANWSLTSGGAGGAGVPTAADVANFTGPAFNNDCNIDVPVAVAGINMQISYSSTLFQNGNNIAIGASGYIQLGGTYVGTTGNFSTTSFREDAGFFTVGSGTFAATTTFSQGTSTTPGTFTASTGRVTIGGNFTLTRGDFTATSDSTFFGGNVSINSGNNSPWSFTHNNGTVVFNSQTLGRTVNIDGFGSGFWELYDMVLAMKVTAPNILTLSSGDNINIHHKADLITGQLSGVTNTFLQIVDAADQNVHALFGGSNLEVHFIGTGTSNYRLDAPYATRSGANVVLGKDNATDSLHIRSLTPGGAIVDGFPTNTVLASTFGVMDFPDNNKVTLNFQQLTVWSFSTIIATSDTLFNNGDHWNQSGTFLHNNGTYVFSGNVSRALIYPSNTSETFYNFVLNKPNVNNNLTLDPGDTATIVENNLVIENGELIAGGGPNTAGFKLNGNLTGKAGMSATSVQLQMTGSSAQTITLDPAVTGNWDGNIMLNQSVPSTVTLNSPVTLDAGLSQVLTFTQGILQTTATNLLTLGDGNTVAGANNNSYTFGPVQKIGFNWFEFPVGAGNFYAPIRVTGGSGNPLDDLDGATTFNAEYIKVNPDALFPVASREDPPLTNVSQCEYWMLSKDAIGPNAYVWLGYDDTRSCGVTNPSLLRVARWDGSMWRDEGNGTVATTPLVRTANSQSNFGLPFTLASLDATANTLPITLTEFLGRAKDDVVELKWTTETEINNKYFDIERSLDGRSFTSIGTVQGAGNTTLIKHYSLTDQNPANGINYYRLKQVDFNGNFTYSKVIAIPVTKLNATVKIYPNPAISNITAEYKGFVNAKVTVQLIDNYGRVVLNSIQQPGASGRVDLQLTNAVKTAGTYWLKMSTDKETIQQKVVINQP